MKTAQLERNALGKVLKSILEIKDLFHQITLYKDDAYESLMRNSSGDIATVLDVYTKGVDGDLLSISLECIQEALEVFNTDMVD